MTIFDVMRIQMLALSMTASHMPCPQPLINEGNWYYDCEQTREAKAIDHREGQADPSAPLRSHFRQLAP